MPALGHQTDVWTDKEFVRFGASSGPMSPSGLSTSVESEFDRQWTERAADLRRIRSLRDDWDGEGAEAPRPEVVDSVEDLLELLRRNQSLPPPSRVVASPNGSVIIEWQMEGGAYREAECSEPYRAEWMLEVPNRPTTHWPQLWESVKSQRQRSSWYRAA
jgi:hypothetical protein